MALLKITFYTAADDNDETRHRAEAVIGHHLGGQFVTVETTTQEEVDKAKATHKPTPPPKAT